MGDGGSDASSGDAGVDAGDAGDAATPPAGGGLCADCFAGNEECSAELRCECSPDNEGYCFCIPGQRGTGTLNTPCVSENECVSGLCVGGEVDEPRYCSVLCRSSAQCAAPLDKCVFGICIPSQ